MFPTRSLAALLLALCMHSSAARADIVQEVLECPGDPCVIYDNPGGKIAAFEQAAEAIKDGARKRVVVAGWCASACTILLDKIGERACLKPNAKLGFHRGTVPVETKFLNIPITTRIMIVDIDYSPPIEKWKASIGGFPEDGSLREMPILTAQGIWRLCDSVPLPRPRPKQSPKKTRIETAFHAHGLY